MLAQWFYIQSLLAMLLQYLYHRIHEFGPILYIVRTCTISWSLKPVVTEAQLGSTTQCADTTLMQPSDALRVIHTC